MALREQFIPDLDRVFLKDSEHATWREFRISDGHGGFRLFRAKVGWFDEESRELMVVKIHGIYRGDVVCYMKHADLPRPPVAGELLYSPANRPWEVLDVTDEEGCWKMTLYGTRTQPGYYGKN